MNVSTFLFLPEPAPRPDVTGGATATGLSNGPEDGSAGSFLACMESMEAEGTTATVPEVRIEDLTRESARGLPRDEGEGPAEPVGTDGANAAPLPPGVTMAPEFVGASEADGKNAAQETTRGEVIIGRSEDWIRLFGDPSSDEGTRAAGAGHAVSKETGIRPPVTHSGSAAQPEEAAAAGRETPPSAGEPVPEARGPRGKSAVPSERPAEGAREGRVEEPEAAGTVGRLRSAVRNSEREPANTTGKVVAEGERMETAFRTRIEENASGRPAPVEGKASSGDAEKGVIEESAEVRAAGRTTEGPEGSDAVRIRRADIRGIEGDRPAPEPAVSRSASSGTDVARTEGPAEKTEARPAAAKGEVLRSADAAEPAREGNAEGRVSFRTGTTPSPEAGEKAEVRPISGPDREENVKTRGAEPAPSMKDRVDRPEAVGETRRFEIDEGKRSVVEERPAQAKTVNRITREGVSEAVRTPEGRTETAETVERVVEKPRVAETVERVVERPAAAAVEAAERTERPASTDPVRVTVETRAEAAVAEERPVSPEGKEIERNGNTDRSPETRGGIASGAADTAETETGEGNENRGFDDSPRRHEPVRIETEAAAAYAARRKTDPAGSRPTETSPAVETAMGVKETAAIQAPGTAPSPASEPAASDRAERALLESRAVRENILDRLTEQTRELVRTGRNEAEVLLDPPELGKVRVKLTVTDATVRGFIEVENPNVQAALQSDLSRLTAALADSGLDLTQFDVLLHDDRRSGDGRANGSLSDRAFSEKGEREGAEEARAERRPRGGNGSRLVDTWM